MGFSIFYQAIPPACKFYQRLQTERPFALIVASLIGQTGRLFRGNESESAIGEAIADAMSRQPEAFDGDAEERTRLAKDLQEEIERMRAAFPGIENREVCLENSVAEIEHRLLAASATWEVSRPRTLVEMMLYGEGPVDALTGESDIALNELSAKSVHEVAGALTRVSPERSFPDEDIASGWHLTQLQAWKDFYLAAASRGDAILIQSS